jgi:hypothetical protein
MRKEDTEKERTKMDDMMWTISLCVLLCSERQFRCHVLNDPLPPPAFTSIQNLIKGDISLPLSLRLYLLRAFRSPDVHFGGLARVHLSTFIRDPETSRQAPSHRDVYSQQGEFFLSNL